MPAGAVPGAPPRGRSQRPRQRGHAVWPTVWDEGWFIVASAANLPQGLEDQVVPPNQALEVSWHMRTCARPLVRGCSSAHACRHGRCYSYDVCLQVFGALKEKGVPTACVLFEGEQHGFRRAPNIRRALDTELEFYGLVFGSGLGQEQGNPVPVFSI